MNVSRFWQEVSRGWPLASGDGLEGNGRHLSSFRVFKREVTAALLGARAGSGIDDDDESWCGRLLAGLAHCSLLRRLSKHSGRVEVVDPGLEEAGSQAQTADLLRLQPELVLALPHPGEAAGHICRLWAERHTRAFSRRSRAGCLRMLTCCSCAVGR